MNSINISGRLTAAPELRHTPQGTAVAEVNLAVDDGYGEAKKAFFFRIVFWDKKAEAAAQHLVKGQRINVTGKLTQETYTPKDSDKPQTSTRIRVFDFDFLDKPKGFEESGDAPPQRERKPHQPVSREEEDEEIPF